MFADTLSIALTTICNTQKISYSAAAEICGISKGYFIRIAKREVSPTIQMLEKICNGLCLTPNDLLISPVLQNQLHYRIPMYITHVQSVLYGKGYTTYPICPRCGSLIEREYQHNCGHCGQCLSWKGFRKAIVVLPKQ